MLEVVGAGAGAVHHIPTRAATPRAPLLTGLEVITIVLGCVVFLGALTAAFCVVCLSKKKYVLYLEISKLIRLVKAIVILYGHLIF